MHTKLPISGIIPVLFSYFDEAGALRLEAFEQQVDWCIGHGASGVMVLGFGTQFYRLSFAEKIEIIERTARAVSGRGTLGVTVMENTLEGQLELVRVAERNGADWIILQPPLGPPPGGARWMQMIERVARSTRLAIAPQNASVAGSTLSIAQLVELRDRCPNILYVKAETNMLDVANLVRDQGDKFGIITGDYGIDFPFQRALGSHGMIPGPNFVPEHVAIDRALAPGGAGLEAALAIHQRILPLMQLIRERGGDESILLAKRAFMRRSGIEVGGERLPVAGPVDERLVAYVDLLSDRLVASQQAEAEGGPRAALAS